MLLLLLLVTLFYVSSVLTGKRDSFSMHIGVQAHSMNDLRQWDSLLLKGITHFKTDVHWVNGSTNFCQRQQRVVNQPCFVLNHNVPTVPGHRLDFNSSTDLVLYLKQHHMTTKLTVALCFKYDESDADLCRDGAFLETATVFLKQLIALMQTPGSQLTIILDGKATPGGGRSSCLANRWQPLNSTFIPFYDPATALTSNEGVFSRFQVLNVETPTPLLLPFRYVAALRYGKFLNSTYNFQAWEPSDGSTINNVVEEYRKTGLVHDPWGLRFASNLDPMQLMTYAAPSTGRAWQQPFSFAPYKFAAATELSENLVLMLLRARTSSSSARSTRLFYALLNSSSVMQAGDPVAYTTNKNASVLPHFQPSQSTVSSVSACEGGMVLVSSNVSVSAYQLHQQQLQFKHSYRLPVDSVSNAAVTAVHCGTGIVLIANQQDCFISLVRLPLAGNSDLTTVCFIESPPPLVSSSSEVVVSISFDVNDVGVGLGSFTTSSKNVYMFYFNSSSSSSSAHSDPSVPVVTSTLPMTAGSYVSVRLSSSMVLVAASDSYCYNTEAKNKMAEGPGLCDRRPVSEPGVLTYAVGQTTAFQHAIATSRPLHTCNATVFVGAFTKANRLSPVSIVLFSGAPDAVPVFHSGLPKMMGRNCGHPKIFHQGPQLTGFPLFNKL